MKKYYTDGDAIWKGENSGTVGIRPRTRAFVTHNTFNTYGNPIREATSFEIQWLKQCIKENRYVPKNEIKWKSSYEIYY